MPRAHTEQYDLTMWSLIWGDQYSVCQALQSAGCDHPSRPKPSHARQAAFCVRYSSSWHQGLPLVGHSGVTLNVP